jgi:hypothetical protein
MVRRTKIANLAFVPLTFLLACQRGDLSDEQISDPNFVRIVAEFNGDMALAWKDTITGDGKVIQEVEQDYPQPRKKRQATISQEDVAAIRAKFDEVDFQGLQPKYQYPANHTSMLRLVLTQNRKTKEVVVRSTEFQASWITYGSKKSKEELDREQNEVRRFIRVWAEILKKVPAPNSEQTPAFYERTYLNER